MLIVPLIVLIIIKHRFKILSGHCWVILQKIEIVSKVSLTIFIKYHHLVLLLLVQSLIDHLLMVSIVIGLLLLLFLLKSPLLVLVVQLVLINLILCWVLVVTRDESLVLGRHLVMLILLLLINIKARV